MATLIKDNGLTTVLMVLESVVFHQALDIQATFQELKDQDLDFIMMLQLKATTRVNGKAACVMDLVKSIGLTDTTISVTFIRIDKTVGAFN